uniref:V-type proton ATPase subunit C n=1 Tax=Lygus hesperus TaxID=30085 RepID=A0A0A9XUE0_LYGHE
MTERMQCWIISIPGSPSAEEAYLELKEIIDRFKGCSVAKFNIPAMKGGAFNYLIKATEEVPKLETESESMVGRIGVNLATVLEKPMLEDGDVAVGEVSLKDYLFTFKWDLNKYPITQNLDTIFGLIRKQMKHVDQQRDAKVRKYMLVHELLNRCEKRRQGPLTTRNYLGDLVTEEDFILGSKFLKTLLVAVPRPLKDQWYASYERLHEEIVPRSTKIISEEEDYVLFSVVVFGRCEKELREVSKKQGFFVRDYEYKENEMFEFNQEISILYSENSKLQEPLIRWLKVQFGEIYAAYIHVKAVKVHIESLLRYGPDAKHQAAVIFLDECHVKKLRAALQQKYSTPGEVGSAGPPKKNKDQAKYDEVVESVEYYPYVFTKLKITIIDLN